MYTTLLNLMSNFIQFKLFLIISIIRHSLCIVNLKQFKFLTQENVLNLIQI